MESFLSVIAHLPMLIAPFILILFTVVTAYVRKFNVPGSGLMKDYVVFAVIIVLSLILGGAIGG